MSRTPQTQEVWQQIFKLMTYTFLSYFGRLLPLGSQSECTRAYPIKYLHTRQCLGELVKSASSWIHDLLWNAWTQAHDWCSTLVWSPEYCCHLQETVAKQVDLERHLATNSEYSLYFLFSIHHEVVVPVIYVRSQPSVRSAAVTVAMSYRHGQISAAALLSFLRVHVSQFCCRQEEVGREIRNAKHAQNNRRIDGLHLPEQFGFVPCARIAVSKLEPKLSQTVMAPRVHNRFCNGNSKKTS